MKKPILYLLYSLSLFISSFTSTTFADEIPTAKAFYNEETGELFWDINRKFKLELINECSSWLSGTPLFNPPICTTSIKPERNFKQTTDIYEDVGIKFSIYGNTYERLEIRYFSSHSDLEQAYNYMHEIMKSNEPVYLSVYRELTPEFRTHIAEVKLDTQNIEAAAQTQEKIYTRTKIKEALVPIISWSIFSILMLGALAGIYLKKRTKIKNALKSTSKLANNLSRNANKLATHINKKLQRGKTKSHTPSSELLALAKLKDDGYISELEFQALKKKIISE